MADKASKNDRDGEAKIVVYPDADLHNADWPKRVGLQKRARGPLAAKAAAADRYNTHLASEFYVLSSLHRLGAEATLTLGNKKAVDIVVVQDAGRAVTVDVKGLAGKTNWPVGRVEPRPNHFLVLVCFRNKISDLQAVPEVYVVPSGKLKKLVYEAPQGLQVVQLARMQKEDAKRFKDAWHLLVGITPKAPAEHGESPARSGRYRPRPSTHRKTGHR